MEAEERERNMEADESSMITDRSEPPACDPEVYRKGKVVFVTHTISPNAIEGWVKQVALLSGQKVDWHFVGGRAFVRALGDIEKVMTVIEQLMPEHARLFAKAQERFLG